MNVFIWEGLDRDSATKSIISGNSQPTLNREYSVSGNSGMLIVVYPNENVDTELSFDFWVTVP